MNKRAFRPYDDMEYMKMGRENLPNPIQVKGPALGGLRNPIQVNRPALGLMQARKRDFQVIVNQHSCTHYSIFMTHNALIVLFIMIICLIIMIIFSNYFDSL